MPPRDSNRLSEKAVDGFADAASYDAHRPSYPPDAVASLLAAARVSDVQGARLLDLAAGTGIFTELLAAREERFNIVAVEPHPGMRDQLARKELDNVTVTDGLSTAIPAENEGLDAVFAAQVGLLGSVFFSFFPSHLAFSCPAICRSFLDDVGLVAACRIMAPQLFPALVSRTPLSTLVWKRCAASQVQDRWRRRR